MVYIKRLITDVPERLSKMFKSNNGTIELMSKSHSLDALSWYLQHFPDSCFEKKYQFWYIRIDDINFILVTTDKRGDSSTLIMLEMEPWYRFGKYKMSFALLKDVEDLSEIVTGGEESGHIMRSLTMLGDHLRFPITEYVYQEKENISGYSRKLIEDILFEPHLRSLKIYKMGFI